jgi:hypothetical protein
MLRESVIGVVGVDLEVSPTPGTSAALLLRREIRPHGALASAQIAGARPLGADSAEIDPSVSAVTV